MTPDTLSRLARIYVRDRIAAGEFAPTTAAPVRSTLLRFAEHANVPAHTLRAAHIERFMASRPIARSTARQRFSHIRQFCRWLVRHEYLAVDPTVHLRAPKQPRAVPRAYRPEEVSRLMTVCPDARARLVCLLEVQEGLRACEVVRLELGDVDFNDREIAVRGKGGHGRVLPLSAETWLALDAYLAWRPATSGPLIRSYNHPREGICAPYLAHMVAGFLHQAGLIGGGHRLRHTMATQLLRQGADIRDIQSALGHALLASTAIYLPFSDAKRLRSVMGANWYGPPRAA